MSNASMPWVKVYTEMLHDYKMKKLTEVQKWRFVQMILLAGDCDENGLLLNGGKPMTIADISLALDVPETRLRSDLDALAKADLISFDPLPICVIHFAERQGRPQQERREAWRQSKAREKERATIERPSTDHRATIDRPSTDHRATIDRPSSDHRPTIDLVSETSGKALETVTIPQGILHLEGEEEKEEEREKMEKMGGAKAPPSPPPPIATTTATPAVVLRVQETTAADATQPASVHPPSMTAPPEIRNQSAPKREYQILGNYPAVRVFEESMCVTLTKLERRVVADEVGRGDCPDGWSLACTRWAERVVSKHYNAHNVLGVVDIWRNGGKFRDELEPAMSAETGALPSARTRAVPGSVSEPAGFAGIREAARRRGIVLEGMIDGNL